MRLSIAVAPQPPARTGPGTRWATPASQGDPSVVDALSATCGLPREGMLAALAGLGLACWSAHQADERGDADGDDAGEDEADQVDGG